MRRNEVWWADLPLPSGPRPVLLLSRDETYYFRAKVVVAEITTRVRGAPAEVVLGEAEGLRLRSVVSLENLRTIPKTALRHRMGALGGARILAVDRALMFALAIREA